MPLLIPDNTEQFTTQGEEVFCRFLRNVAMPDTQFIVWYSPDINDSEPDFIFYTPEVAINKMIPGSLYGVGDTVRCNSNSQ